MVFQEIVAILEYPIGGRDRKGSPVTRKTCWTGHDQAGDLDSIERDRNSLAICNPMALKHYSGQIGVCRQGKRCRVKVIS